MMLCFAQTTISTGEDFKSLRGEALAVFVTHWEMLQPKAVVASSTIMINPLTPAEQAMIDAIDTTRLHPLNTAASEIYKVHSKIYKLPAKEKELLKIKKYMQNILDNMGANGEELVLETYNRSFRFKIISNELICSGGRHNSNSHNTPRWYLKQSGEQIPLKEAIVKYIEEPKPELAMQFPGSSFLVILKPASGLWIVEIVDTTNLSPLINNGKWFSRFIVRMIQRLRG